VTYGIVFIRLTRLSVDVVVLLEMGKGPTGLEVLEHRVVRLTFGDLATN